MHTTPLSLARPCTTNHHAGKRRTAVWSALLSVLILTAAVVAPAAAAPPGTGPGGPTTPAQCKALADMIFREYKEGGASDDEAFTAWEKAMGRCMEKIGRKPKLSK